MDKYSKMIVAGFLLIIIAGLGYWIISLTGNVGVFQATGDFEISDAKYYTDVYETAATLTYKGSTTVNVSYYYEFLYHPYWGSGNQTCNIGQMKKGDSSTVGGYGYVTWVEVIYDGNRIKLTFTPKRTTVSESSP